MHTCMFDLRLALVNVARFREMLQLYASRVLLQQENAIHVRYFAKEAAPPALKGDRK